METYNKLNVFRYEDSEESVREVKGPAIFLAGPTVRGNQPHLTSWRFEAIEIFKERGFEGSLIVPEFTSKTESDKGKKWIPLWEFNGLKRADCILFWVPRTRDEIVDGKIQTGLIALTTNWELGYWMGREITKITYGRPDDAFRIGYLDTMWEAIKGTRDVLDGPGIIPNKSDKIYNNLSDTIDASIDIANTSCLD
jgi:nucleoside 2-deoxyribosyltransferase